MFAVGPKIDFDIKTYRYHRHEYPTKATKAKIAAGAFVGSILPVIAFAKKQHVNIFKAKYGLKEMILTSTSAIVGGLTAGLLFDKKQHRKRKVEEGVFQFMNSTVPALFVAAVYSLSSRIKSLNNKIFKMGAVILGLVGGMHVAAMLANRINDPFDKVPDRKLTLKDSVANIDDAVGAMVIGKVPFAKNLQAEKILPAIYTLCGYRTGTSS